MFKKHHQGRKSANPLFMFFRLILSLTMFIILLGGVYAAYKHFSGMDPLKLDPQAVFQNVIAARTPKELQNALSRFNLDPAKLGLVPKKIVPQQDSNTNESQKPATTSNVSFRFLLVADSHTDNGNLEKAITQGKNKYSDLKFIIGLGDYSEVGTAEELKSAKKVFDSSSLRYFLIPGDHDLWDCRNRELPPADCFVKVFGPDYQSFAFDNYQFLLLDNADNYTGFSSTQSKWITQELEKTKETKVKGIFVFVHTPLYHPSSEHIMGWVTKDLKVQAGGLIFQLKDFNATKVFAGDIHFFSEYSEPKTNLPMATIGSAGIERNPQAPRFAVVSVFDDSSVRVEDIEIK